MGENNIDTLDITNNTKLVSLFAPRTGMLHLEIGNALAMESCSIFENDLTELDVSVWPRLTHFYGYVNRFSSLDFSNNPNMQIIRVEQNQIEDINLTGCTLLREFMAMDNKLQTLDLSTNESIEKAEVEINNLESVVLGEKDKLTRINLDDNQLRYLDASKCRNLNELDIQRNSLDSLNIANGNNAFLYRLRTYTNPDLFCIKIDEGFDYGVFSNSWFVEDHTFIGTSCPTSNTTELAETELIIYPNPVIDKCLVELDKSYLNVKALLTNSQGQNIKKATFTNRAHFSFELPETKGLYYLQLYLDGQKHSIKTLIKN